MHSIDPSKKKVEEIRLQYTTFRNKMLLWKNVPRVNYTTPLLTLFVYHIKLLGLFYIQQMCTLLEKISG